MTHTAKSDALSKGACGFSTGFLFYKGDEILIFKNSITTARKVILKKTEKFYDTSHILNIIPLEKFPIIYAPFDCVYKPPNYFEGASFKFEISGANLARDFKSGDMIKKYEPVVVYAPTEDAGFITIEFYDLEGNPSSYTPITGLPQPESTRDVYRLEEQNIFDTEWDNEQCKNCYRVVWSFGAVTNKKPQQPFVKNFIQYVKEGEPAVVPEHPDVIDSTVFMNSSTLNIYNGEGIFENTILTALYNAESSEFTVRYTHAENFEDKGTPIVKSFKPFYIQNKKPIYLIPRFSYNKTDVFALSDDLLKNLYYELGDTYGGIIFRAGLSTDTTPVILPIDNNLSFGDYEIDIFYYGEYINVLKFTTTTKPPYDRKDGFFVNWDALRFMGDDAFQDPPLPEHEPVLRSGLYFYGIQGEPLPPPVVDEKDIIPILITYASLQGGNISQNIVDMLKNMY